MRAEIRIRIKPAVSGEIPSTEGCQGGSKREMVFRKKL